VRAVRRDGAEWEVALDERAEPSRVIQALASAIAPSRIEVRRPTLEDVFISIVSGRASLAGDDSARLRAALREGDGDRGGRR